MKQSSKPKSGLMTLMDCFTEEADCLNYLKKLLWKSEKPSACPRCGHTTLYHFTDGQTHKCVGCRKKFNVLTGTMYENSKIPLRKWFFALYLVTSQKRGISSYQLAMHIRVTQKTAWFMLQRLRKMYAQLKTNRLEGICTADETYIGGKEKNKHYNKRTRGQQGRGSSKKISVFGVMQVGGQVFSQAVADVGQKTLQKIIDEKVEKGSTLMTDEWHGYNLAAQNYTHMICDHGRYQYVSDTGATINPIENYWSHVKRAIMGTYYHVSRKHIERYLAEFDYKFNYRQLNGDERFNLTLSCLQGTRLKYKTLIANA